MAADPEPLLRAVADAAQARAPLPAALRASGARGADAIADALERGADLRTAFAHALPPATLDLLAGERPSLERRALLALAQARAADERRRALRDAIAYPVVSMLVVAVAAAVVAARTGLGLEPGWLALAISALALLALMVLAGVVPALRRRLPWLAAWRDHLEREDACRRAALAARWRLTEAEAQALLGIDLGRLGPWLAEGGEAGLLRLADHHAWRARRAVRSLALCAALVLHLLAGALFLAAGARVVESWSGTMMAAGADPVDGG